MTPEELFRGLDMFYKREISTGEFRRKLQSLELGLSEKDIHRLALIFDEDFNGSITLDEYYFGLDTYNGRGEDIAPYDNDPDYISNTWQSLLKF